MPAPRTTISRISWAAATILVAAFGLVALARLGPFDGSDPLSRTSVDEQGQDQPSPPGVLPATQPGSAKRSSASDLLSAPLRDPHGSAPPLATLVLDLQGPNGEGLPGRAELRRSGDDPSQPLVAADISPIEPTAIELDEAGRFVLRLSRYPPGYMPPGESSGQIFIDEEHLEFDLVLDLQPGPNRETVRLLPATRIEGHVRDGKGRGVADVLVCAHVQGTSRPRDHYGTTDPSGSYSILCTPGRVRLQVHLQRDHPLSESARPLPRDLDLLEHSTEVVDFRLTEEGGLVSGRIVDQDGLPVEGMYVLCTYRPDESHLPEDQRGVYTQRDYVQSAHSGPEGRFALVGLPPGRFSVLIGPEDYRPVGKGRLGMRIPIRTVAVQELEQVDLGRIDVWTSRPFRVTGRIDLTGEWAERDSVVDELTLLALLQVGERRTRVQEKPVELRAVPGGLEFDWACETPEEGVLLELRGPEGLVVQEWIWPSANERAQVRLRFPK